MNDLLTKTCQNCIYAHHYPGEAVEVYRCRRYPPPDLNQWPEVWPVHYCGEWVSKDSTAYQFLTPR